VIVHFIRHGQSYNTHRASGEPYPANPPLTSIGVREAQRLAERVKLLPIERLISSPMLRSVETASIVARASGHRVEVWPTCYEFRRESGYWCWGAHEMLSRYPDLVAGDDFAAGDWWYGEEPIERALARATAVVTTVRELAASGAAKQLAIVTHGAFTRLVISRLLDVPAASLEPLILDNTSFCTVDFNGAVKLRAVNDTAHLIGGGDCDPLAGVTR
jgi:probable phosphoglycerate mutase